MTKPTTKRGIVVGVDGTEESMAALRWAAQQARVLHTDVVAVHAWEPIGPLHAPYAPASARPTAAEQRARAAQLLASTLRTAFGSRTDGTVRAVLAEGPPARMLLHHAHGALLLALGLKSRAEYGATPLGPVGRECLRHAAIPVVAVPVAERPARPDASARHTVVRPLLVRSDTARRTERGASPPTGPSSPSVAVR
ncbi:universal stress protein [Streptomyces sp. TLI_146]|uniref:universal stress protein n=1 Tax=Streptomyces sp. TLI_146 TaxID=1938858 RepID=UPI000C712D46|nr:universal stress protein [Streptomyces sp. TLI_146]PKV83151.1 nucleotide-binding universal stress UspA family protein [Streptomyces sp. TLI_146]